MVSSLWLSKDVLRECSIDLVRGYLGIALFLKGIAFASRPDLLASLVPEQGGLSLSGGILAHYVIGAHLCGGFCLALGLVTRIAAAVQLPILFGAVFFVHWKQGLFTEYQNLELAALVLFLLLVITLTGAGKLSLDYLLFRSKQLSAAPV